MKTLMKLKLQLWKRERALIGGALDIIMQGKRV